MIKIFISFTEELATGIFNWNNFPSESIFSLFQKIFLAKDYSFWNDKLVNFKSTLIDFSQIVTSWITKNDVIRKMIKQGDGVGVYVW